MTRAAGPFVAADVLASARRLSAYEALRARIVAEVVAPEELLDAALAKAGAILKVAPLAVREILALVRVAMDTPLAEGLDREHEALLRLRRTSEAAEGVRAFVEKREPRFEGS